MSNWFAKKPIKSSVVLTFATILTAGALQAKQPEEIPPWGRFEDPSGQATLQVDGSAVLVTSGKNSMTVEDTLGSMPRIVREVSGDFDVRVRVSGNFAPKQKAVLLAFADPREYLRVTSGLGLYPASVELSTGIVTGGAMNERTHRPKQPSMWLRVRRVAGELSSYYSTDGEEWLFSASSKDIELKDGGRVSFTAPMQVMLLVHNQRARTPLTARFEQFELQEGAEIQPITVAEDPAEKALRLYEEARAKRVKSNFIGFALTIVAALGWIVFFTGLRERKALRFSVRRLFGFVTLVGMSLGTAMIFAPTGDQNVGDVFESIPAVILAAVTALAIYAGCDPWSRCPAALVAERPATVGNPFRTGLITRILAILIGVFFLLFGGFASALIVEDNWALDTGGASGKEWLMGLAFIASTMIGSFARGATLVGFLALLCGAPLGRDFAKHFGLCGGSFLALLLWVPAHDVAVNYAAEDYSLRTAYGNLASGIVGLLTLFGCWWIAWWFVGRGVTFGRRARRRAGRLYLLGLLIGTGSALIPTVQWLLFGMPPASLFFGAMIGSSLGAILGMLTGASEN